MNSSQFSLKNKMIIGFSLILGVVVLALLFSIFQLSKITKISNNIMHDRYEKLKKSEHTLSYLYSSGISLRN